LHFGFNLVLNPLFFGSSDIYPLLPNPEFFTGAEFKSKPVKHAAHINEPNSYKINSYAENIVSLLQRRTVSFQEMNTVYDEDNTIPKYILY
jgi:hypothetical protein